MPDKALWVVLAEVESVDSATGLQLGEKAFVNAIVPACPYEMVSEVVGNKLNSMGFHLVSMETPQAWNTRFESRIPDDKLLSLAAVARKTSEVQFGTFHTWKGQG